MTFKIKYSLFDKDNNVVKWGEILAKNKRNELQAKISLEKYMRKKYTFSHMVVHECKLDHSEAIRSGSYMGIFNDVFNSKKW